MSDAVTAVMTVAAADRRVTRTPNATMTTLASPTLGGAVGSLWLVEMEAEVRGPVHAFDSQVLWSVTTGTLTVETEDGTAALAAGDTAILPAGRPRRIVAGAAGFTAVVTLTGPGEATREDGSSAGVPPWVA